MTYQTKEQLRRRDAWVAEKARREERELIREWANDNVWTGADGQVIFADAFYRFLQDERESSLGRDVEAVSS